MRERERKKGVDKFHDWHIALDAYAFCVVSKVCFVRFKVFFRVNNIDINTLMFSSKFVFYDLWSIINYIWQKQISGISIKKSVDKAIFSSSNRAFITLSSISPTIPKASRNVHCAVLHFAHLISSCVYFGCLNPFDANTQYTQIHNSISNVHSACAGISFEQGTHSSFLIIAHKEIPTKFHLCTVSVFFSFYFALHFICCWITLCWLLIVICRHSDILTCMYVCVLVYVCLYFVIIWYLRIEYCQLFRSMTQFFCLVAILFLCFLCISYCSVVAV